MRLALAAAEKLGQTGVEIVGLIELEIADVAEVAEILEQRRLDRRVLPHEEEHRRARAAEHVVRQLERAALAHADADVDEGIGLREPSQPPSAEVLRREGLARFGLERGAEG